MLTLSRLGLISRPKLVDSVLILIELLGSVGCGCMEPMV